MSFSKQYGAHNNGIAWVGCPIHRFHGADMDKSYEVRVCTLCTPTRKNADMRHVCPCPTDKLYNRIGVYKSCGQCAPCAVCSPKVVITEEELASSRSIRDFNLDDFRMP